MVIYSLPKIKAHPFFEEEAFEKEMGIREKALTKLFSENEAVKLTLSTDKYYIISPSVKSDLPYQATLFYKGEPIFDMQRDLKGLVQEFEFTAVTVSEVVPKRELKPTLAEQIQTAQEKQILKNERRSEVCQNTIEI